jgi:O-antigen ligase
MGQGKRFARHAGLGLALFAVSVPVLGLGDYLFATRSGEDLSEKGHRDSVLSGLQYVAEHPLGGGNEKIGPRPAEGNSNAFLVENTYLAFATEYGIMGLLCFLGFIFSALRLAMRQKSPLGYSSLGILFGIGLVMLVFNLHDDRRLACWEWFPIGLLVGASTRTPIQKLSCPR